MSRGLGKVERKIIETLKTKEKGKPMKIAEIRKTLYGDHATESQKQTLWRSIRKLHNKGILDYGAPQILFTVWAKRATEKGYDVDAYQDLCLKRHPYRGYYLSD